MKLLVIGYSSQTNCFLILSMIGNILMVFYLLIRVNTSKHCIDNKKNNFPSPRGEGKYEDEHGDY